MSSTVPLLQHPPETAQRKHEHELQLVVRPARCTLMLDTLCSLQAAARSIIAVQLQLQCGPYATCLGRSHWWQPTGPFGQLFATALDFWVVAVELLDKARVYWPPTWSSLPAELVRLVCRVALVFPMA